MSHILDDFIFFGPKDSDSCLNDLQSFMQIASLINLPIKHSKTHLPSPIAVLHGIEIDTNSMQARLPRDKILKASNMLHLLSKKRRVTLAEQQSIIGFLNFACRVIVPGRAFLRRLINLTHGLTKPNHHVRLNKNARLDINAWLTFLSSFNGTTILRRFVWETSQKLHLYSDAASKHGFAAILGSEWFQGVFPQDWDQFHITFKELYPITAAVVVWGTQLANKCILMHCDNQAVVHIINSLTSKDNDIMCLVRHLVVSCMRFNIQFQAEHIPGSVNTIADLLSRSQVRHALKIAPWLKEHQTPLPVHLHPSNILSNNY